MDNKFLVGYGRADINPEEPCPLGGFGTGKTRIHQRITDSLYVTCLALTDGEGKTVLLISCDLQRPQESAIKLFRESISAATGIAQDHICISGTHTHSCPSLLCTDNPVIQRYYEKMKRQFAAAAVEALADRKEASFHTGQMATERLNFVKHYKQANGQYCGDNFGRFKESPIVSHASPVHNTMYVIRIARKEGRDIVICNFRAHPTLTGGKFKTECSADFIGPLRDSVEKQKDCDFVFFQGAAGNINAKSRIPEENLTRDYVAYGSLLAEAVIKILNKHMVQVPAGKLQIRQINYLCPIDHSRDHQVEQAREVMDVWYSSGYDYMQWKPLCEKYDFSSAYHAMAIIGKAKLGPEENVELDVVTIGDQMAFVSAPGELWDSVSVEMERRSPFPMSMTLGYANGDRKYFPHGVGLTYRSYESDYARVVPGTADKVIDLWVETLSEFYKNS